MWLEKQIPPVWREALKPVMASGSLKALETFLDAEFQQFTVLPAKSRLFAALEHTSPDQVKVLLLGQDPYPTEGHANGLAFSVSPGVKVPASLRNLYAALETELGHPRAASGDLTAWAEQGVLLLNTVLSVRAGESNSHRKHGWESLTTAIVQHIAQREKPTAFLCLGKPAQALVRECAPAPQHLVLNLPHPSPLNGAAFVTEAKGVKPFTRINTFLEDAGRSPVSWALEAP